ncbi:alcohol dehydrogenase catalytic domain-containing protein [Arthrobacter sp. NPDC089319]|uniref:alcohol dehydrogenase catalytic domain-containing protein n=1 Tax=Arthrobacter sp. NPDC089319 TaxID=3155915 RepID=UPI003448D6C2
MRSAFFPEVGRVTVAELPDPELLNPTDALIRVHAAAICGSDLHIRAGHITPETGFPIGHEYVGEIEALGSAVTRFSIGDRVTGPAAPYCRSCEMCQRGQHQLCQRGGILGSGPAMGGLDGAQAELIRVPWADQSLVKVPEEVSDAAAIAVADILSTGWSGVRQARPQPGETLAVFGCGPVGLSAVHTAKRISAASQVIAVDPVESRRRLARKLGADAVMAPDDATVEVIRDLTRGVGAAAVVDAAGVQSTMDMACEVVAVGGRIAELGIASQPFTLDFGRLLMKNATIWTGLGDLTRMNELMALVGDGTLDPNPMFTHSCTLDELPAMYDRLAEGDPEIVKVLVTVEGNKTAGEAT